MEINIEEILIEKWFTDIKCVKIGYNKMSVSWKIDWTYRENIFNWYWEWWNFFITQWDNKLNQEQLNKLFTTNYT